MEKADPSNTSHIAAPFAGAVTVTVEEGQRLERGNVVATMEAMKIEANITTATAGTVRRVTISESRQVEGGDLIVVID